MAMEYGKRMGGWMVAVLLGLALEPARGQWEWGGVIEEGREQNLRVTAGAVLEFEGMVTETTRRLYDVTGRTWSQADAESYGTSDFNLDGPYGTIGLSFDSAWKFFRLQVDTCFMNPDTKATAKRDYYIAVSDDISYNGKKYDHLMIPKGTEFEAELLGNLTELTLEFVPFGLTIDDLVTINPSLGAGLLLFGGQYDIDAGETRGVKTYQNPPEDFAIGGSSGGLVGLGAPQWGPGLEVRVGGTEGVVFDFEIQYLFSSYDGSTAWLTTADHRDKNLDFDHRNLRLRGQFEFPTGDLALTIGFLAQFVETEGTVSSTATDPEEILALRERFDKEFNLTVNSLMVTLGFAF